MNSQDFLNLQEAYLDVYNEGKSSRPRYPGGRGVLDQETRDEKREASAENMRGHTEGPGTVTKNPKKLRKQKSMGELGEQKNIYDIILSHLLDEGYADTEQAAEAIMVNMSEEWRESIVETRMDPRGRPASGPMNVYANPKGKPDQAHLDAVKSYDEKQKKKTPEQRKAELDAYKERQMNNK